MSKPGSISVSAEALPSILILITNFTGIVRPEEFRTMTRAHIIAWHDDLTRRGLGGSTLQLVHQCNSIFVCFGGSRRGVSSMDNRGLPPQTSNLYCLPAEPAELP